jgi:hypothetical protein
VCVFRLSNAFCFFRFLNFPLLLMRVYCLNVLIILWQNALQLCLCQHNITEKIFPYQDQVTYILVHILKWGAIIFSFQCVFSSKFNFFHDNYIMTKCFTIMSFFRLNIGILVRRIHQWQLLFNGEGSVTWHWRWNPCFSRLVCLKLDTNM